MYVCIVYTNRERTYSHMYICHPHIFAHSYVPISVYLDVSGSYHHPTHTHTHRHTNTHSVDKHKLYCTYMIVYCIPTYMYFVADTSNIKWASFVVFHSSIFDVQDLKCK